MVTDAAPTPLGSPGGGTSLLPSNFAVSGVKATFWQLKLPRSLLALPKAIVGIAIAAVAPTAVMAAKALLCMLVPSQWTTSMIRCPRQGPTRVSSAPEGGQTRRVGVEAAR